MALLVTPPVLGTLEQWRDGLKSLMPELEIRLWPNIGDPEDIHYILVGRFDLNDMPDLPNLRALMPMFAGLDHLLYHPKCPPVAILRTGQPRGDKAMTEYAVMHVLRHHRRMQEYQIQQKHKKWEVLNQKQPHEQTIGFMGFGQMAASPARILVEMGFDVSAWVRNVREEDLVKLYFGQNDYISFLRRTNILVCLLPLTNSTKHILSADTFKELPRGASIINLGRGEHLVEEDLIKYLDSNHLRGATLDATSPEPLPKESQLWKHKKITIMPHVARRVRPESVGPQVIENIRRDISGLPFLWQVDREAGY
ncbi:MAG: glyoxylate/hydroxypyruvate reductase A [Alphaproteobacteria bacterium]|nr:glyoxylate/hydroxypyruvate reductase A [Alphaproteobacteria bacterium]